MMSWARWLPLKTLPIFEASDRNSHGFGGCVDRD